MNYHQENNIVFVKLNKGEYINSSFEAISKTKNIGCSWLNGIGAIENPEIGFYSIQSQSYHKKIFIGEFEITSLIGNITIKEGKPFSHTHITFSDVKFNVFGGHLFDAKISAAGEFILFLGEKNINRKLDSEIGLPLWCLENKFG